MVDIKVLPTVNTHTQSMVIDTFALTLVTASFLVYLYYLVSHDIQLNKDVPDQQHQ